LSISGACEALEFDIAGADEGCEGSFEAPNRLGRSVEGLDKEAKGLEASLVVDWAGAALGASDVDGFLNKLLELLLSGWNV
jgi:hypothetical protein